MQMHDNSYVSSKVGSIWDGAEFRAAPLLFILFVQAIRKKKKIKERK